MKKILSIALAVVMVLSLASVAMAFNWSAPTSSLSDFNYQIDVMKFTSQTADFGSASFLADDMATAVNGAPVYFAIKLTVPADVDDDIKDNAKVDVDFTAIEGMKGVEELSISSLGKGTYYYYDGTQSFQPIEFFRANVHGMNYIAETPVYARACLDTDSAKVEAKVYSNRPLGKWFSVGGYDIGKTYVSSTSAATVTNLGSATAQELNTPQYGLSNQARKFKVQIVAPTFAANTTGEVTVTYIIGGVSAKLTMNTGVAATDISAAIAREFGNSVTLNIAGQSVPFSVSSEGAAVVFTEISNTAYQNSLVYQNLGNNLPDVSATLGGATGGVEVVEFREAASSIGSGDLVAVLPLNSDDKVLAIITNGAEAIAYDDDADDPVEAAYENGSWAGTAAAIDLLEWLDDGNAGAFKDAVAAGQVYMTDSNMRTAFGFANSVSDSITWKANSTPIILDPTVSIPKTGDNASVIGFAMIMAAVVLAAVAVKKVKA